MALHKSGAWMYDLLKTTLAMESATHHIEVFIEVRYQLKFQRLLWGIQFSRQNQFCKKGWINHSFWLHNLVDSA